MIKTTLLFILLLTFHSIVSANRFTDNSDGTITDLKTSLEWQQQDDNSSKPWLTALSYCEGLEIGSKTDWRLPNVKELSSIVDYSKSPTIDETAFPDTESMYYWTSTSIENTYALFVEFANGVIFYQYNDTAGLGGEYFVRCVRGGS